MPVAPNGATEPAPVSLPVATAPNQAPGLPYGAQEVLKMYKGGISKDIIVNYVNSSTLPFHLSADAIIYLQGAGIPVDVTRAMIQRDGELQQQRAASAAAYMPPPNYAQQQQQPPLMPPPQGASVNPPMVAAPSTPPPNVTVIGGDSEPYAYGNPDYYDYGYPYGYWGGPIVIGGGWWGGGWGRGGWGGYHGGFGGVRGGFGGGFHGGGFAGHGGAGGHR